MRSAPSCATQPASSSSPRCSKFLHTGRTDPTSVTKFALGSLARRINDLTDEIAELDALIAPIVNNTAPQLAELVGVGPEIVSALLVAAGHNPERLRTEATFAHSVESH